MVTVTDQDETIWVDGDYELQFTETDAVDLSNFNGVEWVLRDSSVTDTNILQKTQSGGGITIDGASNERADVIVNAADWPEPANGIDTYHHRLLTTDGTGNTQVAATGTLTLRT